MDIYDIRYNICLYLDIEDFLRLTEVCKYMRLLTLDGSLWRYYIKRDFNKKVKGSKNKYVKLYNSVSRRMNDVGLMEIIMTRDKIDINKLMSVCNDIRVRIGPERLRSLSVDKLYDYMYKKKGHWVIIDKYKEGRILRGDMKFLVRSYLIDYLEICIMGGKALRYFFSQIDEI